MATQAKSSAALDELIVINNDRNEGYKTAAQETKDSELKDLFNEYAMQSGDFAKELRQFANGESAPKRDETKTSGKLYRTWMDVKSAVTGNDRKAILASCEFGEDTAKKHYEDVLKHPEDLPAQAESVVRRQSEELKKAHDRIKALRDSAANSK